MTTTNGQGLPASTSAAARMAGSRESPPKPRRKAGHPGGRGAGDARPSHRGAVQEPEATKPLLHTLPGLLVSSDTGPGPHKVPFGSKSKDPGQMRAPRNLCTHIGGRTGQGQASLSGGNELKKTTMAVRTPCPIKKTPKHSKRERTRAQRCVQKEMSDFSLPCAHKERKETKTHCEVKPRGTVEVWAPGTAGEPASRGRRSQDTWFSSLLEKFPKSPSASSLSLDGKAQLPGWAVTGTGVGP